MGRAGSARDMVWLLAPVTIRGDPLLYVPHTRFRPRYDREPTLTIPAAAAREVYELLSAARRYLGTSGGWTQRARARTDRGEAVPPTHAEAARYSLLGALDRAWAESHPFASLSPYLPYELAKGVLAVVAFRVARDGTALLQEENDHRDVTSRHVDAWLEAALAQLANGLRNEA